MENKNLGKKIAVAGNKNVTRDLIEGLLEGGYSIDHLITLHPSHDQVKTVSGYMDLWDFAKENKIGVYHPLKYNLKTEGDTENIKFLNLDLLIALGWQRLIPNWFLESLPYGSYGMHGSSEPLPKGRGRSPLNWSLIEDKRRFLTHLIRHDPGVDTGNIIAVQEFDINEYDTAETLHYKNQISAKRLLLDNLPKILSENYKGDPQFGDPGAKYPKRTAEDGLINWNNNTKDIYNLVRAVTDPFPGAFSYLENKKVMIWQAQPFDTKIIYQDSSPGEIVDIFYSGDFVVKTKSDSLLIMDYEGINEKDIKKGLTLRDLAKSE